MRFAEPDLTADFASHHIEGYAHAAVSRGMDGAFRVPLISEITQNLWMGGCRDNVLLPDEFNFVLSLYPWEQYRLGPNTRRTEVRMLDSTALPDAQVLFSLADTVNRERHNGPVLVHCQAGLNRSGLITALALALEGRPVHAAIDLLREKRSPVVLCNETFEHWLLTHVAVWQAQS